MCFHPRHDLTMAEMTTDDISTVIHTWVDQVSELSQLPFGPTYIQVFENKGAVMGCSNPHPHCQVGGCFLAPIGWPGMGCKHVV